MDIHERTIGDITVFRLDGGLGLDNYREFSRRMDALISPEKKKVIIDLNQLTYLSSWGIGILVSVAGKIRKLGGVAKFANLHSEIAGVLHVMRLDKVLDLYPSLDDAVASLNERAAPPAKEKG